MNIKKIVFKNFKSFGENEGNQTLQDFDLLNLIYGENNSGKSNILKFIDLIFSRKYELDEPFDVEGETLAKPGGKTSFYKGKIVDDAFLFHKNNRSLEIKFNV